MVKLVIEKTARGYRQDDQWVLFDKLVVENFESVEEAKKWIDENYKKCKKTPIYRGSKKVGYVVGFRNSGFAQDGSLKNWIEQDWIEFFESVDIEKGGKKWNTKK